MKRLWNHIKCLLGDHDWTCKAAQGIKPQDHELNNGLAGFWEYATMYCSRCKKVYRS